MTRKLSHIGISVASLDRSILFYQQLLGAEVMVEGPFEGRDYGRILRLESPAGRVALLKAGDIELELFEFAHPIPEPMSHDRPVCNHGITHFCIEVANIDEEYERLSRCGVIFHCAPMEFFGTAKATYGRDPDGNVFELVQVLDPAPAVAG